MSLIKCPECGKEVSDKAKVCTNCGYQLIDNSFNSYLDRNIKAIQGDSNNPFKTQN